MSQEIKFRSDAVVELVKHFAGDADVLAGTQRPRVTSQLRKN